MVLLMQNLMFLMFWPSNFGVRYVKKKQFEKKKGSKPDLNIQRI